MIGEAAALFAYCEVFEYLLDNYPGILSSELGFEEKERDPTKPARIELLAQLEQGFYLAGRGPGVADSVLASWKKSTGDRLVEEEKDWKKGVRATQEGEVGSIAFGEAYHFSIGKLAKFCVNHNLTVLSLDQNRVLRSHWHPLHLHLLEDRAGRVEDDWQQSGWTTESGSGWGDWD